MWTFPKRAGGIALALVAVHAQACGPDFPEVLHEQRAAALLGMPSFSFLDEIRQVVRKPDFGFPAADKNAVDSARQRAEVEVAGLGVAQARIIESMRVLSDGEAAYALGDGLPEAIRLYTAGAVAFHAAVPPRPTFTGYDDEPAPPSVPIAPQVIAQQRALARQYFSRVLDLPPQQNAARVVWATYMLGRLAAEENEMAAARAHFQRTRELVRSGNADPLALAAASLGEEAWALLHATDAPLVAAIVQALALYAEQAALGSERAQQSILLLMRQHFETPGLADAALHDPVVRPLLFLYATHRDDDKLRLATRLADAMAAQDLDNVTGADTIAASAYRIGHFNLAHKLAARAQTPLAHWIRAKLELRGGRTAEAMRDYSAAIRGFIAQGEAQPSWSNEFGANSYTGACRASSELGLVHLSRNDYLEALRALYGGAAEYWQDAAYVAERIVDIDQLKQFVDEDPATRTEALRNLLARRLMRAQRYAEAAQYFAGEDERRAARQYADALDAAESRWRLMALRARAWFTAATIARRNGMELFGYEAAPDFAIYGGAFELSDPPAIAGPFATADENRRYQQSRAQPDVRFHYRVLAADHAQRAADLLPPRSQAFAAVLCSATQWLLIREPERAQTIYRRYLREGAYVEWGEAFGQSCPEPEFDRALTFYPRQQWQKILRWRP